DSSIIGEWKEIKEAIVGAMHLILVRPTKLLFIDKAGKNPDAVYPDGRYAYSSEYDLTTGNSRILNLKTNTFCSAGSFIENGTLIESGGDDDAFGALNGSQSIRLYNSCDDGSCDWLEFPYLDTARWYNTMTTLPDGRILNFGGSTIGTTINNASVNNPTYEFYPKKSKSVKFQFLVDTLPYNLYPAVFVLPGPSDQTWLYISANKKAIVWDYSESVIVRHLPDIPGGPRTYPATGTIFITPLHYEDNYAAEIVACGGSAEKKADAKSDNDCARLNLAKPDSGWTLEPFGDFDTGRLMGDYVYLPDGKVLIVNGAGVGFAGWDTGDVTNRTHSASIPQKMPLLYDPKAPLGSRFTRMAEAKYVRVYHSAATLIPDGTVFVAGSNPNEVYCDTCEYPTDIKGTKTFNSLTSIQVKYGETVTITMKLDDHIANITASLIHHGFSTHSQHMSSRYVSLKTENQVPIKSGYAVDVTLPPHPNIMPPGRHNYIYILNRGTPANTAIEINLKRS
ncbi:6376_t:CDS:2, partial [Cetraspora pellucida]